MFFRLLMEPWHTYAEEFIGSIGSIVGIWPCRLQSSLTNLRLCPGYLLESDIVQVSLLLESRKCSVRTGPTTGKEILWSYAIVSSVHHRFVFVCCLFLRCEKNAETHLFQYESSLRYLRHTTITIGYYIYSQSLVSNNAGLFTKYGHDLTWAHLTLRLAACTSCHQNNIVPKIAYVEATLSICFTVCSLLLALLLFAPWRRQTLGLRCLKIGRRSFCQPETPS